MQDLGTLGGKHSQANAINAADEVVGGADTTDNELHAFRYGRGRMEDIHPERAVCSEAQAINDAGLIAGTLQNGDMKDVAWLISGQQPVILDTLADPRTGGKVTVARAINNRNQMVANSYAQAKTEALLFSLR